MHTAEADEVIKRSPCHLKGAGLEHAAERPMLETATVIKLADVINPLLRAMVFLGGFVGLRPGELLGLQRHDVDLLHRVVHIRRQAHEITGQGRILTGPKPESTVRPSVGDR